jgi:sugar phosphate isomerase/epimerase
MKLGCSTILYGQHGVDDALAGISQAGYSAIELCAIPGMGLHVEPGRSEAEYTDLKRRITDRELAIDSIGATGNDPYDASPESGFRRLMEAAAILGAPALTTGSGGESGNKEDMLRAADVFNGLAEFGKGLGVKVSVKPHVGGVVHNTPSSLEFMSLVDTDWIGLNVDASHLWRAQPDWEAGEESIPKLAQYILTARIRDTLDHDAPIGPVETQVPGGGAMDLKAVMCAFAEVPGLEYVTLEIVGTAGWDLDQIQERVASSHEVLWPLCGS